MEIYAPTTASNIIVSRITADTISVLLTYLPFVSYRCKDTNDTRRENPL